jgi:signal peptidase II
LPATGKETSANTTRPRSESPGKPARRSLAAVAVFLLVSAGGLGGDLVSKQYVFNSMLSDPSVQAKLNALLDTYGPDRPPTSKVLADLHVQRQLVWGVRLTLSTNPGVVFGMPMLSPLVIGATVLAVVLVACFFATSPAKAYWTHVALALIVAGALGNLYDRLIGQVNMSGLEPIRGQVRDFIDCSQIGYKWVFNLADVWLVVGVAMMIVQWIRDGRRDRNRAKSAAKA